MPHIFISYAGQEGREIAEKIQAWLPKISALVGRKTPIKAFVADNSILPGEEWEEVIAKNIRACKSFLFIVTKESIESEFAAQEAGAALILGKNVVPILGERMTPKHLPGFLKARQALSLADMQITTERMTQSIARQRENEAEATLMAFVLLLFKA